MPLVKAYREEILEVQIPDETIISEFEALIIKKMNLRKGQWISDGDIYEEVCTSHCWDHVVGPATEEQIEVFNALCCLINFARKVENEDNS